MMLLIVYSPGLPPPNVNILFFGNSTAGEVYSLNCTASVVDGLIVLPDLVIVGPDSTMSSMNNTSSLIYTFTPLRTSDGGEYTCTATVNILEAEITDLQSSTTKTITVSSQYYCTSSDTDINILSS